MSKESIETVALSNADQAIGTIVLGFSADPVARWFYPDPHDYLTHLPHFVRAFAGKAFECNSAYQIDGYSGASLWLPPEVHPDENALMALLQCTIPKENQQNIFAFVEQMDRYHPSEPHWYLPMIGVDPAKQGNGYGSALLKHVLERCDGEGKLAYLEASSAKSIPLYQRHGFERVGTIQVEKSPPMFPMLRKPRRLVLTESNDYSSRHATGSAPDSTSVLNRTPVA
jgi:ribosomal protein S18 acetylase RimI-like enzyme